MPDIGAASEAGIVALLAAIVTLLLAATSYLFKQLIEELRSRATRAEALYKGSQESYDTLASATDKASEVAQAALDELRRRL